MNTPRDTAKKLIELAADKTTSEDERIAAATKACAIIRKHNLLGSPLDAFQDDETVQAATEIFSVLTNPDLAKNLKKIGSKLKKGIRRRG